MNLRGLTFSVTICLILLNGCGTGPPYNTLRIHEQIDDHTIWRMTGNELEGTSILPKASLELNLQWSWFGGKLRAARQLTSSDSLCPSCKFSFIVRFTDEDWLLIEEGESLVIMVDNERFTFSGDGSSEHRFVRKGYVEEFAVYEIDVDMFNLLAQPGIIVKVKVIGSQSFIERDFSKSNLSNFQRFWHEFFHFGSKVYYLLN